MGSGRLDGAIIAPGQSWASVGRDVTSLAIDRRIGARWWLAFAAACALVGLMAISTGWLLFQGVGIWGNNVPGTWAGLSHQSFCRVERSAGRDILLDPA